jgi:dynein heavy chain 1
MNYNQLMRDFPIAALLSANDLEAIRMAIIDIFAHLKKMRNTKYPGSRATKLIQTLSRDLSDQVLRVLSGQGLMHVRYPP